jgi:hypothetical protein
MKLHHPERAGAVHMGLVMNKVRGRIPGRTVAAAIGLPVKGGGQ